LGRPGGMRRAAGTLVGGTVLAQGLVVATSPIIARLYRVEDFGVLGVFTAIIGVTVCVASVGYEKAVPVSGNEREAANTLAVSLAVTLAVAFLLASALALFGRQLTALLGVPALLPYRALLVVSLTGVAMYQALNYWAIRIGAYRAMARTKVWQGFGQVTAQLGLGVMATGPFGLLLGDVVSRVAGVTSLLGLSGGALRRASLAGMLRAAVRYREFPLFGAPAALLHTGVSQLPTLILSSLFGPSVTGSYAFGIRIISGSLTLVAGAIAQPLLGRAAVLAREDPRALKRVLRSATRMMFLGFGVPVAVLTAFGAPLFALVFGPKWYEAGLYGQLYGFGVLVVVVIGPIFPVLGLLERQRWLLIANGGGFALIVGGLFLVKSMGLGSRVAMVSLGVSWSALYFVLYALTMRAVDCQIARMDASARATGLLQTDHRGPYNVLGDVAGE
jgi:O-antigen/teichoic acid export membrane protein